MSKIIEVDSSVLEMALLRMWHLGHQYTKDVFHDEKAVDLQDLDYVWEQYLGEKVE